MRARYPFVAVRAYGLVPPGVLGRPQAAGGCFVDFTARQDIAAAHSDGFLANGDVNTQTPSRSAHTRTSVTYVTLVKVALVGAKTARPCGANLPLSFCYNIAEED